MSYDVSEKIKENFANIIYDEVKYGIVTSLDWYGSLNLKKLAELVGRPETTTIRYIKQLLEEGLIDVDAEKTAISWGKYYRLSKAAQKLTEERNTLRENRQEEVMKELLEYRSRSEEEAIDLFRKQILAKEDLEQVAFDLKNILNFTHNAENIIANEFATKLDQLIKLKEEKSIDYLEKNLIIEPGDIMNYTERIQFTKYKDMIEFYEIFAKFVIGIKSLKDKIQKEIDSEKIPEDKIKIMNIHIFMGSNEFNHYLKEEKKENP
ncbi:MAG: winged helix-turn-helix transcriptional regulator [Asgard group archaeon]|nr:winged helix-turn-helix transcriptional regulator [Asgard group archaeon]